MKNNDTKYEQALKIEKLLDEVYADLSSLTEDNFIDKFPAASLKMETIREINYKNSLKINNFKPSKKIVQMAKLISDKYDSIIKDWADRLKTVQKEIELTQNQKKITIYNR